MNIRQTKLFDSLSLVSLLHPRLSDLNFTLSCELDKGVVFYDLCPLFLNPGLPLIVSEMRGFLL